MQKPYKPSPYIQIKKSVRISTAKDVFDLFDKENLKPEKVEITRDNSNFIVAAWAELKDDPDYPFYMKRYEEDLIRYKEYLQKLIANADKED